jgi:hypothetical protein
MNPLIQRRPPKNVNLACVDSVTMGERELAAFFRAVTELFGSEQAEHSAEDWLHELETVNGLPASIREWQLITARVATRLANRVAPVFVSLNRKQ